MMIPCRTLALLPLALLGACGGTANRGIESVYQPVVSRSAYAFDLVTDGQGLAAGEQVRLAGWLDTLNLRYGDEIGIDDPNGAQSNVRDEVAGEAARRGLALAETAPPTAGAVAPGTVRVVVSRMVAMVPSCPDNSRTYQPNFDAHTSSNHGCAINSNLAAMVARPGDLVLGRSDQGTTDQQVGTKAVGVLRRAVPSGSGGLRSEGTGSSKQ